jgi:hypothetical protein
MQGSLPTLARRDAAFGIEIEEDTIEAFRSQPISNRNRLKIVPARMMRKMRDISLRYTPWSRLATTFTGRQGSIE